jgi:hypothetical protein
MFSFSGNILFLCVSIFRWETVLRKLRLRKVKCVTQHAACAPIAEIARRYFNIILITTDASLVTGLVLQGPCLWCSNQNRCVDKNAYIPSFPYGLCTEWTTHENKCRDLDFPQLEDGGSSGQRNVPLGASVYTKMTTCKSHRSCSECQVENGHLVVWLKYGITFNIIFFSRICRRIPLAAGVMMVQTEEQELACQVVSVVL